MQDYATSSKKIVKMDLQLKLYAIWNNQNLWGPLATALPKCCADEIYVKSKGCIQR